MFGLIIQEDNNMVRKNKYISIADRLSQMYRNNIQEPPDVLGAVSLQRDLLKQIDDVKFRAVKEALNKYNAESFTPNNISISVPDATYVAPIPNVTFKTEKAKSRRAVKGSSTPVKSYSGRKADFTTNIYNSYYRNLISSGSSPNDAKRQATYLTQKTVHETGYGQHIYAQHNYGGHEVPDGKGGVRRLKFNSMDDYTKADIALLDRKWKPWRKAKSDDEFVTYITTDYGSGKYNAVDPQYRNKIKSTSKRVNSYINMGREKLKYGGVERPKAWLGAVIGAVTSIAGGLLQARQKRKAEERAAREEAHNNSLKEAASIASAINTNRAYQDAYYRQFRMGYNNGGRVKASFGLAELLPTIGSFAGSLVDDIKKKPVVEDIEETTYRQGGRRHLRDGVSITDGGYAIPIGQNTFLLRGGSHEDINETGQTGIGINIGGKEIEAEGGEVVQKTPKELRVFSDTITLPNGLTPAEAVEYGANKNNIFKIQQSMNGDYGRRTMRNGGHCSRPVGRIKADDGIVIRNGRRYKKVNYPNSNKTYWQDLGSANNSEGFFSRTFKSIKDALNSKPQPTGRKPKTGFTASNMPASNGPYNANIRTVNKSNTNNSNGDAISKALASKGLANTPENRRLYVLANKKGGTTQAGMNYTGTRNGGTLDEIVVTGRAPYTDLSGAVSNYREDLSYLDKDDNRNIVRNSNNSSSTGTYSTPKRSSGRRRLRNSGRTNIGAFNVPDISNPDSAPVTSPLQLLSDDDKSRLSAMYSEAPTVDTSILSNGVIPKQSVGNSLTGTPDSTTTPFKRYTTSDWIGLGADLVGSLGSTIINSVASNSIKDPVRPVSYTPSKLPTIYNIRPQLDEINRMRNRMLDDSNESSSSVGRLSRRNYINTFATDAENRLWGEKTNRENEMLTRDALNQQQIGQMNVAALNDYYDRLIDARNRRGIGRAQALQFGLSGLSDAVGNFLDQGRQNYADNQAMKYYAALLGNNGIEWLRRSGVNVRNGGRLRLRNI